MKKENKVKWFWIILAATIIDLFIPDPLPLIEEIGLIALSLYSWRKAFK